jgi:hypothetical protein
LEDSAICGYIMCAYVYISMVVYVIIALTPSPLAGEGGGEGAMHKMRE